MSNYYYLGVELTILETLKSSIFMVVAASIYSPSAR
jgi:hypothetical protein